MRHFLLYGAIGAVAGTLAAVVGNFAMPKLRMRDFTTGGDMVDVRALQTFNQPHEYITYFLLGALVCSLIAALANESRGPQVQIRSFLIGLPLGGVLCVAANSLVGFVAIQMARRVSPDLLLTHSQYSPIHDLCFFLYYAIVPASLALALTVAVGVNRFTLMRGLVCAGLASVISGVLIHLAFLIIAPFMIVSLMNSGSARNVDLTVFIKPLLIAHLFGMGLGASLAFAVAQMIYKPAWLKGMNGWMEGRTLLIPSPIAMIGVREDLNLRIPSDGGVQLIHAQIDTNKERHLIRGVMGEVRINGNLVQEHWLADNDVVQLGNYRFRYRTRLSTDGAPPPVPKFDPVAPATPSAPAAPVVTRPQQLVLEDPLGGKHPVSAGKTVVGRDAGVGISLPWEPTVSRKHAELALANGSLTVSDLGSSNGTFVNGIAVESGVPIQPGDELRLGKCVLKIKLE